MNFLKMPKKQLNNERLARNQERFIKSIEGIGDILAFYTKRRNKIKSVIDGLNRLEKIIEDLFNIQRNEPEKFEKLLLTQEFFDLHKKDKREAQLRLSLSPENT